MTQEKRNKYTKCSAAAIHKDIVFHCTGNIAVILQFLIQRNYSVFTYLSCCLQPIEFHNTAIPKHNH